MIDFLILGTILVGVIVFGLYFLNKWAAKKMNTQQSFIESSKQSATIYVIDKKRCKISEVTMPKIVVDQMPRYTKFMKMYFVKAKIGPQIQTLMCDKHVFAAITTKKNVKVELAGIYIVNIIGMKSKSEMKAIKKQKKSNNKK